MRVEGEFAEAFAYLFNTDKIAWEPELDTKDQLEPDEPNLERSRMRARKAPEEGPWYSVRDLKPRAAGEATSKELALLEASPSSGSFIMLSPRRRAR